MHIFEYKITYLLNFKTISTIDFIGCELFSHTHKHCLLLITNINYRLILIYQFVFLIVYQ